FRRAVLCRSQGRAVAVHVGRLHRSAVYALECWMARASRGGVVLSRFPGRDWRLGSQFRQQHAQVHAMKFLLSGVNHKTAPVEVRERFAIPESRLPDALRLLLAQPGVQEGMRSEERRVGKEG